MTSTQKGGMHTYFIFAKKTSSNVEFQRKKFRLVNTVNLYSTYRYACKCNRGFIECAEFKNYSN